MYDEKQNNFIAVNKNELLNDLLDSRMSRLVRKNYIFSN